MEALVANRGALSRALNVASGKSIEQGCQVKSIPVPVISDQEILFRVHAVALNPIDLGPSTFLLRARVLSAATIQERWPRSGSMR